MFTPFDLKYFASGIIHYSSKSEPYSMSLNLIPEDLNQTYAFLSIKHSHEGSLRESVAF